MEDLYKNCAESDGAKLKVPEHEFCCFVLQKSILFVLVSKLGKGKMTSLIASVGPERI